MLEGYMGIKVQEVYMLDSTTSFSSRTVDLAHEKNKMVEGVLVFWPSKFLKLAKVWGN